MTVTPQLHGNGDQDRHHLQDKDQNERNHSEDQKEQTQPGGRRQAEGHHHSRQLAQQDQEGDMGEIV